MRVVFPSSPLVISCLINFFDERIALSSKFMQAQLPKLVRRIVIEKEAKDGEITYLESNELLAPLQLKISAASFTLHRGSRLATRFAPHLRALDILSYSCKPNSLNSLSRSCPNLTTLIIRSALYGTEMNGPFPYHISEELIMFTSVRTLVIPAHLVPSLVAVHSLSPLVVKSSDSKLPPLVDPLRSLFAHNAGAGKSPITPEALYPAFGQLLVDQLQEADLSADLINHRFEDYDTIFTMLFRRYPARVTKALIVSLVERGADLLLPVVHHNGQLTSPVILLALLSVAQLAETVPFLLRTISAKVGESQLLASLRDSLGHNVLHRAAVLFDSQLFDHLIEGIQQFDKALLPRLIQDDSVCGETVLLRAFCAMKSQWGIESRHVWITNVLVENGADRDAVARDTGETTLTHFMQFSVFDFPEVGMKGLLRALHSKKQGLPRRICPWAFCRYLGVALPILSKIVVKKYARTSRIPSIAYQWILLAAPEAERAGLPERSGPLKKLLSLGADPEFQNWPERCPGECVNCDIHQTRKMQLRPDWYDYSHMSAWHFSKAQLPGGPSTSSV